MISAFNSKSYKSSRGILHQTYRNNIEFLTCQREEILPVATTCSF